MSGLEITPPIGLEGPDQCILREKRALCPNMREPGQPFCKKHMEELRAIVTCATGGSIIVSYDEPLYKRAKLTP